jgi:hypothetical protein
MTAIVLRGLLVTVLVPALAGGVSEAMAFNNAISKTTKDLEKLGKDFGQALAQNKGNPAKLKELHDGVIADASKLIKKARALKVPDLEQAKEFHRAFVEYLDAEEKVLKKDFGEVINLLAKQDNAGLQAVVRRMGEYENTYVNKLKDAQQKFAKAHNFTIKK